MGQLRDFQLASVKNLIGCVIARAFGNTRVFVIFLTLHCAKLTPLACLPFFLFRLVRRRACVMSSCFPCSSRGREPDAAQGQARRPSSAASLGDREGFQEQGATYV